MNEEILKEFQATTQDLIETVSLFTQESFNKIPFEGSWTAGQVAEHIFKSEKGVPHVYNSKTVVTERDPAENVAAIKSIFLNYDIKMKSPEFIIPSDGVHQQDELLQAIKTVREKITALAETLDLTETCTEFPFPQMGTLTRLEWLHFITYHSTRHIRQMKNIHQHVAK